ncbi:MAG: hypothetical protein FWE74_03245 [Oscillospiraceae bacterium]|nr:hypothetical protein [Oscillospiraceae bacterium]
MAVLCPVCNTNTGKQNDCPKCKANLSQFISVHYAPDILINEAIELVGAKEYRAAYDKLAAAHYLRPHDNEIVAEMARICEIIGDFRGAMEKIAALVVNSDNPELKDEYARLDLKLRKQQEKEKADTEAAERMLGEIKALIKQAFVEVLKEKR